MSRYILQRIGEDFGVVISFAPKLFPQWMGAGAHLNFSTRTMREGKKGMDYIFDIIKRLG
jgi:glutamine synthetase